MSTPQSEKLRLDILESLVGGGAIFAVLYVFASPTVVLDNISAFNSTVSTLFGLLFTVLAIVYTFESEFKENKAVRVLRSNDQYIDIISIFFYTVAVIGGVWVFTFSLTIFNVHSQLGQTIQRILSFIAISCFLAVIIRLWRCFSVFILLNRAVREHE